MVCRRLQGRLHGPQQADNIARPMRVAHILRKYNPLEWGGTETAVRQLLDGLREQGVESVVHCPSLDTPPPDVDPLAASGHPVKRFKAFVPIWGISSECRRQLISLGGNILSWEAIRSLWHESDLSVIHSH